MKKFVAVIMLALFCLGLCACSESEVPEGMQLASGENAPFYFYVPQSWNLNTSSGISSAYYSNGKDKSNVQVTVHLSEDDTASVEEFWEEASGDYQKELDEFATVGEPEAAILGGLKAQKYVFTAKIGKIEYKYMQVIAYYSGYFYIFTYTAEAEYYDAHLEDVNSMIEAFSF